MILKNNQYLCLSNKTYMVILKYSTFSYRVIVQGLLQGLQCLMPPPGKINSLYFIFHVLSFLAFCLSNHSLINLIDYENTEVISNANLLVIRLNDSSFHNTSHQVSWNICLWLSYEQLKSLSRAYYANKPNLNI